MLILSQKKFGKKRLKKRLKSKIILIILGYWMVFPTKRGMNFALFKTQVEKNNF